MTWRQQAAPAETDVSPDARPERRFPRVLRRCASWLRSAGDPVRSILGAPDYERYVTHMRRHHPHAEPLSRHEYATKWMENRYRRPGSRCC